MRKLAVDAKDFRAAMGQLVSAMTGGLRSGVPVRPVDVARDRLIIATDLGSSGSFNDLGAVCMRLRDLPASVPVDAAAVTVDERKCLGTLLHIIRLAWEEATDRLPAEEEIREFLRILEVTVFDFKSEVGRDFTRCGVMLDRAKVRGPFSVLAGIGLDAAKSRAWRQRHSLTAVLQGGERPDLAVQQLKAAQKVLDAAGRVPDTVFRSDVRALLEATAERASRSGLPPYLTPGRDVLRMSRTVRLLGRVRRPGEGRKGREDAYALPSERDDRAGKPPQSWEQVRAAQDRLMVLGDPGMGKSWLLRLEAHRLAEAALAVPGGPAIGADAAVPVLSRADVLAAAPGKYTLAEVAAWYLVRDGFLPARSRERMRDLIAGGGAVLLVDSLDEVPREAPVGGGQAPRKRLEDLLARWAEQCPRARFVVASRLAGHTPLSVRDVEEAELLPFTPRDISASVQAWNLPDQAGDWLRGQLANPAVAGMARVPLLLTLICSLAADPYQRSKKENLPGTRVALYGEVVWRFLSGAHRASEYGAPAPALDQASRQHLLDVLTHVAVTFARDPRGWIDRMRYQELADAVEGAGDVLADLGGSPGAVIDQLAGKAGILVPAGNPAAGEQDYVFLHRTLAEYLVARYLHDLDARSRMEIIAGHQWFDPDWAEVIPMLGGLYGTREREEASTLVRHFLSQRPDPLHYAFRTALRILGDSPDPDQMLTPRQEKQLARKTHRLLTAATTRDMMTSTLAAASAWPTPVTRTLLNLLTDDHLDVRWAAVHMLGGRDGDDVTRALLGLLTNDDDRGVRQAAVRVLGGRDGGDVTRALLDLLTNDDDPHVRGEAVRVLGGRDGDDVTRALLDLLTNSDRDIRREAVHVLGGRSSGDVTRALLDLLTNSDRISDRRRFACWVAVTAMMSPGRSWACSPTTTTRVSAGRRSACWVAVTAMTLPGRFWACSPTTTTRVSAGRRSACWAAVTAMTSPGRFWACSPTTTTLVSAGRRFMCWAAVTAMTLPKVSWTCLPTTVTGISAGRQFACWAAVTAMTLPGRSWTCSPTATGISAGRRFTCWGPAAAVTLPRLSWTCSPTTTTGWSARRRFACWAAVTAMTLPRRSWTCSPTTATRLSDRLRFACWAAVTAMTLPRLSWACLPTATGISAGRRFTCWVAAAAVTLPRLSWACSPTATGLSAGRRFACWVAVTAMTLPGRFWACSPTTTTRVSAGRRSACWVAVTAMTSPKLSWACSLTTPRVSAGRRRMCWVAATSM